MPDEPTPSTWRWEEQSAPELSALAARDPVAVLPLGAIEQHGPHLPVSTDLVIARGLASRALEAVPDDVPVVLLPELSSGASLEHDRFAGTLSLAADTLAEILLQQGAALARQGFRRLVLFNTHGGNAHVVDDVGLRLRTEHGLLVVKAHSFRFPRPTSTELPDEEWVHGLHGGAVETSMLLHLRPDLVRAEHIARFSTLGEELASTLRWVSPEGVAPFSWLAGDLNPHGVTGDARLATEAIGAELVEHYAAVLATIVRETWAFPVDRLEDAP
ncbi:MAG: creatininase family protein [Gemmatimonadota bacterium]|nr:creatininase family protein [Gemmatimonadota bacterium]